MPITCHVRMLTSLYLEALAAQISPRLFAGIRFIGREDTILDEVPALYTERPALGVRFILCGSSERDGYVLLAEDWNSDHGRNPPQPGSTPVVDVSAAAREVLRNIPDLHFPLEPCHTERSLISTPRPSQPPEIRKRAANGGGIARVGRWQAAPHAGTPLWCRLRIITDFPLEDVASIVSGRALGEITFKAAARRSPAQAHVARSVQQLVGLRFFLMGQSGGEGYWLFSQAGPDGLDPTLQNSPAMIAFFDLNDEKRLIIREVERQFGLHPPAEEQKPA